MADPELLQTILYSCITLALLITSAFISGSEVAFFSLTETDLDELEDKKGSTLKTLLKKPQKLLANILIANNAVNILIVLLFDNLGKVFFKNLNRSIDLFFFNLNIRQLVEIGLVTFLILLFGEVLPKVYANRNAKKFALLMAPIINVLTKIFFLFAEPLIRISDILEKQLRKKKSNFSVEDLSHALELTSEEATTDEQKNILEGIVNFGNTETVQIMTPRTDISALGITETFTSVLIKIKAQGFSRTPIFGESIDEIKGVLYTKDLLPYLHKQNFDWQKLIREPFFIPENKKLDDLLIDFKEKKNHLAIVVDEYGGTSGLVTLEDVIEEIVGDISNEFDEEDLPYSKLDDNTYVFDGKINLKDFCKVLKLEESDFEKHQGESETLAGLLLEISGKFPRKFEKINFQDFQFTIESIDRKRIRQVKVNLNV